MLDPAFKHVFWCCGSPWKGEWKSDSGVIKRGHCNVHQVPHCAPLTSLRTASTSGWTDSIKPSLLKVSKGEKNMLDWGHWKIEERAWSQWQQRFALPCTSWLYTLEQTLPFFFFTAVGHICPDDLLVLQLQRFDFSPADSLSADFLPAMLATMMVKCHKQLLHQWCNDCVPSPIQITKTNNRHPSHISPECRPPRWRWWQKKNSHTTKVNREKVIYDNKTQKHCYA